MLAYFRKWANLLGTLCLLMCSCTSVPDFSVIPKSSVHPNSETLSRSNLLAQPVGPSQLFSSIDEAAAHLLGFAALKTQSERYKRERGGDIKYDPTSNLYFYDGLEVGSNDSVDVFVGEYTVAIAHTHPPAHYHGNYSKFLATQNNNLSNQNLSRLDRKMVIDANRILGKTISTYLASTDGSVTKFVASDNYQKAHLVLPKGSLRFNLSDEND
jgi:hypothetical protein